MQQHPFPTVHVFTKNLAIHVMFPQKVTTMFIIIMMCLLNFLQTVDVLPQKLSIPTTSHLCPHKISKKIIEFHLKSILAPPKPAKFTKFVDFHQKLAFPAPLGHTEKVRILVRLSTALYGQNTAFVRVDLLYVLYTYFIRI